MRVEVSILGKSLARDAPLPERGPRLQLSLVTIEALEIQRGIIRSMTLEQKLRASEMLRDAAWQLKAAWLRRLHPDMPERDIQNAVRDWFLGGSA